MKTKLTKAQREIMKVQRLAREKSRRDYWKTAFTLWKEHRDGCGTCREGCPIFGPLCSTGSVLRNNSIDEISKESDAGRAALKDGAK